MAGGGSGLLVAAPAWAAAGGRRWRLHAAMPAATACDAVLLHCIIVGPLTMIHSPAINNRAAFFSRKHDWCLKNLRL